VIPGQLRAMVMSLPEVIERQTWGKATFRVQNKLFVTLALDGSSATLKSSPEEQQALIAADPDTFTTAAHLGRHGWITVLLDRVDKSDMEELVTDAWRRAAPKGLLSERHSQS
jgi:hypothetical protein